MRKHYDDTFKQDAVNLLVTSGRPLKVLAHELGVTPQSLRSWRDRYFKRPPSTEGSAPQDPRTLYEQNKTLRRENDLLRRQRDILKKALSIVSDPPAGGML